MAHAEASLEALVDAAKVERAKKAVYGGAKPDTAEIKLVQKLRGEYQGDALVVEVYKGIGGLVDLARAKKNREAEAKRARERASR